MKEPTKFKPLQPVIKARQKLMFNLFKQCSLRSAYLGLVSVNDKLNAGVNFLKEKIKCNTYL